MRKLNLMSSHVLFVAVASVLAAFVAGGQAMADSSMRGVHSFQASRASKNVDLVQAALEIGGDLKLEENGKVERVKMSVAAEFIYHERSLPAAAGGTHPGRSVRHYRKAGGVIQSGEYQYEPVLRGERRLIGVAVDSPRVTLFSPRGPLTFEELDLIDVPANTLLLDRLLPTRPVAVGKTWDHDDELVAALLGVDEISQCDVKSELTQVADGKAEFEMSGRLSGAEGGVATQIELKAKYHFDLQRRRITWLGLLVREDRSAGPDAAAFGVVARMQIKVTPDSRSEHLTDRALAGLSLEPTAELTELSYASVGGGWSFLHDRRWSVITEEEGQAVLRFIDRGDKLAQCNVASMHETEKATEVTLEEFQGDISRGLSEKFESFVQAGQWHSQADYRVFRVVAQGEISGVAMRWIYYLVTSRHGRRVVLAFVLEEEMLGRFERADEKLVAALRLADPKVAAQPVSDRPAQRGAR